MRFEILGPMRVSVGNRPVPIQGERERGLLAVLLLQPGHTVPVDQLAETVWDGVAPSNSRGQLHSCVSRLRRRLSKGGIGADVIATDPDSWSGELGCTAD